AVSSLADSPHGFERAGRCTRSACYSGSASTPPPRSGCSRSLPESQPTKSPYLPSSRYRCSSRRGLARWAPPTAPSLCPPYGWAFPNPFRRIFYTLTVTSLSVAVALIVGTIELVQVAVGVLGLDGGPWTAAKSIDLNRVGYGIAALFVITWAGAAILWRAARFEERWSGRLDRASPRSERSRHTLSRPHPVQIPASAPHTIEGGTK